ncbi:hypothetical protein BGZ95_000783 [Linnemannia exigua]|uniref:F-box domain-containing protein n=1 Tax=Linnemannia exigua TaxID=604196 RepID=A0AAD4DJ98_9FUNG|nr:hypothetical protein BGZ95_000783 [Linnemannia exigua]
MATNTTHTTINTDGPQNINIFLSDIPLEILWQVADYLPRKTLQSCILLNQSLSRSFLPYVWRHINVFHFYPSQKKMTPVERFQRFKEQSVDTGALARNGGHIRTLKGVFVEWIEQVFTAEVVGSQLVELSILSYCCPLPRQSIPNYMSNFEGVVSRLCRTLSMFLQHQANGSNKLRRLRLGIDVLCRENEEDLELLLASIPRSVEEMVFRNWLGSRDAEDYIRIGMNKWTPLGIDNVVVEDFQRKDAERRTQAARQGSQLPSGLFSTLTGATTTSDTISTDASAEPGFLPHLKRLVFDKSCICQATMDLLLPWFPALESLSLFDSNIVQPVQLTRSIQTHCPLLSTLCISRSQGENYHRLIESTCSLLLCASLGGWKTVALSTFQPHSLQPSAQALLLQHAATLETIFFQGCRVGSPFVFRVLGSAPRLKRFVVVSARKVPVKIDPSFVEEMDWVCRDLEVFRIMMNMNRAHDRPHKGGRRNDNGESIVSATDMVQYAEGLSAQRKVYRQIGQLTKLKELIIGDIENDELSHNPFMKLARDRSGSRFSRHYPNSRPSHDNNLTSGLDLLGNLKQLRRVGLIDMESGGFMECEEDKVWVKEHWPLVKEGYRDYFWKKLKHL